LSGVEGADFPSDWATGACPAVLIGGSFRRSPQNRQNLPSGKRVLPQLAHTLSSTISIGSKYYARGAGM